MVYSTIHLFIHPFIYQSFFSFLCSLCIVYFFFLKNITPSIINVLVACKARFLSFYYIPYPPGAFSKYCGGVFCRRWWQCLGYFNTIGKPHKGNAYLKRICLYGIYCVNVFLFIYHNILLIFSINKPLI